jgi:peptidoglycan/LPS O-acetylase OafA/YrhL
LGVDIFFVISGYVITSSLAGRESKNFLDFVTGFYERRIKRLVPALVVFVLITSVLICLFNPNPGGALGIGWKSLFGLSNIGLYRSSTDYFAQSTELNPFTHTWSLGVEEQFYLLFPFLIWFSGFEQQTARGARNLFFWVGAMTIASLLGFVYLYQVNQPAAYFLMPPRFWEMAAGCLLFIGFQKRAKIEQALEQVPPLLVVVAMVGVMHLPVTSAVPATIGIVALSAILIACLKQGTAAYRFFTLERVVYIGLISYSLYLWHWTILSISRWTIGIHWWSFMPLTLLIIFASILSYEFIEKPIRRGGQLDLNRISNLLVGLITLTASAAFAKEGISRIVKPLGSPLSKTYGATWKSVPAWEECHSDGELDDFLRVPDPLKVKLVMRRCTTASKGKPHLFITGNSHGAQLFGLHHLLAEQYSVTGVSVGWCPFLGDPEYTDAKRCPSHRRITQELYKELILHSIRRGDIVVISNRFTMGDAIPGGFNPKTWLTKSASTRVQRFSDEVKRRGGKLLVFAPLPEFGALHSVELCRKTWYRPGIDEHCRVSRTSLLFNRSQDHQAIKGLKRSGITFVDAFASLCPNAKCEVVDSSGGDLFSDTNHLTDLAVSKYLYPKLMELIKPGWRQLQ